MGGDPQGRRSSSIGRRLAATIFLTSGLALTLACGVFLVYDTVSFRRDTVREIRNLAQVIGIHTADALRFDDPEAASLTLRSLGGAPETMATVVYDAGGEVFATYHAQDLRVDFFEPPPAPKHATHRFEADHLDLFQPLVLEGEQVGTILVRWDTRALSRRVQSYLLIVGVLLVVVYALSLWIAGSLRDRVANPLTELSRGAQAISEGRLSIRMPSRSNDEIGRLAGAFNAMAEGLGELISRVRENITAVSEVAEGLRADSGQISADAARQQEAIGEASRSIDQLTEAVRDVAQNVSHLAGRARDTSTSILQMDGSINEVASNMEELAGSLDGASSGTHEMAVNVREIVAAMESLEAATEETAALLRQLAEAVASVEENAKESGGLSHEAREEAARGMGAVEETIAAMREIRKSFGRIESSVRGFAQKSDAIGAVLSVIEAVVDETNLLALNAAIIASQAGEHGKAFAVVANQIKGLAERTARSTKEISGLIESVQRETSAAVIAVEAGSDTVEKGVERSGVAGEVLKAIMQKSDRTARRVHEIVEATSHQATDIREVEAAMMRVRGRVEQTNRSAHEQEKVGSAIAEMVHRMRELGQQVKRLMGEQSRESRLITSAVGDVATGVHQILQATRAQAAESERIHQTLGVFREVAAGSGRRARSFQQMVAKLGERSQRLRETSDRFKT